MKEKFINFLKEHDAYEKFIKNLESAEIYPSFDVFCRVEGFLDWTSTAFNWDSTPEGYRFWFELDDLWVGDNFDIM